MAPVGAVHLIFGALSGFVTRHLLRAGLLRPQAEAAPQPEDDADRSSSEVGHG
jgi:hypothetical protein